MTWLFGAIWTVAAHRPSNHTSHIAIYYLHLWGQDSADQVLVPCDCEEVVSLLYFVQYDQADSDSLILAHSTSPVLCGPHVMPCDS